MKKQFLVILQFLVICSFGQVKSIHDLDFSNLAASWDQGIPLGNGMLGALIWKKDSNLRISLDRADLWDLRPVKEISLPQFSFSWVKEQVNKQSYDTVQKLFDLPYDRDPAPTKIPAGALEFPISQLGEVQSIHLFLVNAMCEVRWKAGTRFLSFIDATQTLGWFRWENPPTNFKPIFESPQYFDTSNNKTENSPQGQSLARLGYPRGNLEYDPNSIYFMQRGWGDFVYEVSVIWRKTDSRTIEGCWCITTRNTPYSPDKSAWTITHDAFANGMSFDIALKNHAQWWHDFWAKSDLHVPDTILENQWYREIYKFGSASRKGSPPLSLQAIWTADNGLLPPWKGDFHNDLNTELSYWPGYSSNHVQESEAFTDWIRLNQKQAADYTTKYFNCPGLNFPGVSTLTGAPMGGWIQYAFSPTTSAWLAQYFYNEWEFSHDTVFLRTVCYPYLHEVAVFLDNLAIKTGKTKNLPLSSSPEIGDNSLNAWYTSITNFDLSLVRSVYQEAYETARFLGKDNEAWYWKRGLSEWPDLAMDKDNGLMIAQDFPYTTSHRHFSHLMTIFPLGQIDILNSKRDREIVNSSLKELETAGTSEWCGYSFAWLGNIYARAGRGEDAAKTLRTFATCFCFPNSFHVNGDQSNTGKSNFTYHPFTLEGNFACASGIQEMLLQSQNDIIRIFPAVPASWKDISFHNLRARGAFLVSATKKDGKITEIRILPEAGGKLVIQDPYKGKRGRVRVSITGVHGLIRIHSGLMEANTTMGKEVVIRSYKTGTHSN
jgi:alpha-L-fucosidase 2